MIRAVFFDIDETLYGFNNVSIPGAGKAAEYIQKELQVPPFLWQQAVDMAQERIAGRLGWDCPSFHNRQIRYQNALEILGKPIYPYGTEAYRVYWNYVLDHMKPEPGIKDLLGELKRRNVYLGIGTDMTSYIQNQKLERLGVISYFDSIVSSEEAGRDKPDQEIFRLCMEKAGCSPRECLFVGDSWPRDIEGARRVGMHALCYSRYSKAKPKDGILCIDTYEKGAFFRAMEQYGLAVGR